jgi:hypothetical protein
MRHTRIATLIFLLAAVLGLVGCASTAPTAGTRAATTSGESSPSAAATPVAQYAATFTSGGAAVGTEMQRTAGFDLACEAWVMSVSGKADLAGAQPHLSVVAVNANGSRTVMWSMPGEGTSGVGSEQGTFMAHVPVGTTTLLVTSTLRSATATGDAPSLKVNLSDVPVVKALNGAQY